MRRLLCGIVDRQRLESTILKIYVNHKTGAASAAAAADSCLCRRPTARLYCPSQGYWLVVCKAKYTQLRFKCIQAKLLCLDYIFFLSSTTVLLSNRVLPKPCVMKSYSVCSAILFHLRLYILRHVHGLFKCLSIIVVLAACWAGWLASSTLPPAYCCAGNIHSAKCCRSEWILHKMSFSGRPCLSWNRGMETICHIVGSGTWRTRRNSCNCFNPLMGRLCGTRFPKRIVVRIRILVKHFQRQRRRWRQAWVKQDKGAASLHYITMLKSVIIKPIIICLCRAVPPVIYPIIRHPGTRRLSELITGSDYRF